MHFALADRERTIGIRGMNDSSSRSGKGASRPGASANHFSTVVPIADTSGKIIDNRRAEFPNRGRAWWMLRGEARVTHAPPGCLIMSGIEDASDSSSAPDKDIYQLLQPTLPGPKDLLEILSPDAKISDPNELLDGCRMRCDHEPTRYVLVRIGQHLYGPLKVELDRPENDRLIEPEIRFTKPIAPHTVYRIAVAEAERRAGHFRHEVVVQSDASWWNDQFGHTVRYEAITGALYEELREKADEVDVVSLHDAFSQVSRDSLSKRERREFLDRAGQFGSEEQSVLDRDRARPALLEQGSARNSTRWTKSSTRSFPTKAFGRRSIRRSRPRLRNGWTRKRRRSTPAQKSKSGNSARS